MATDSTVKILLHRCLRSGCNYAADILSLDWVEMDLKYKIWKYCILSHPCSLYHTALVRFNIQLLKYTFC